MRFTLNEATKADRTLSRAQQRSELAGEHVRARTVPGYGAPAPPPRERTTRTRNFAVAARAVLRSGRATR